MFDWCQNDNHSECRREYNVFYIDPRSNKPVYTGEIRKCMCKKRGCKCYTRPADRPKRPRRKRKQ